MHRNRPFRSVARWSCVATLAGGSLFSTCQTRVRDSIVDGSTAFLFSILDPTSVADLLLGDDEDAAEAVE